MTKYPLSILSTTNKTILTTLISVAVVFVLMITIVSNFLFAKSIERGKDMATDDAKSITIAIEQTINSLPQLLRLTQRSLTELDMSSDTADISYKNVLSGILDSNPGIFSAWLVLEPGGHNEEQLFISEFMRQNGKIIETTTPSRERLRENPQSVPWYYQPLTTGRTFFEAFVPRNDNNDRLIYTMTISMPVIINEKIVGVCGLAVLYQDILSIVNDLHRIQNRTVILLSPDLTILHAQDLDLIGNNLADYSFENIDDIRTAIAENDVYAKETKSSLIHEKAFMYLQPISVNIGSGQPLYLQISTPLNTLYADANSVVSAMAAVGLASMILIVGIVFLNVNGLLRPIRALTHQARQIAGGDFKAEVFSFPDKSFPDDGFPDDNRRTKNETVVLRQAFDKMLRALQDNLSTIEHRVDERTRDLHRSNNYIKQLLDYTSTISILLDKHMNIMYCSDSVLRLMNSTSFEGFFGRPLTYGQRSIEDEGYLERSHIRMARIIAGQEDVFTEDDTVNWPNGENGLYRIIYKRIQDENGSFDGAVIVMRDLTDVRVEEAQLRMNDVLFSTQMPCFIYDGNGEVVAYNKECRIFGLPTDLAPEDFHRKYSACQPTFQPDGRLTEDLNQELFREGITKGFAQIKALVTNFQGKPMHFEINAARIPWLNDFRLVTYFHDQTSLVEIEAEAKEAEDRIKLMLNSTPLICILRDGQNNIIDCNQEALKIFGVATKEDFMRDFPSFYPEFQPNGTKSPEAILKKLYELKEAVISEPFEWMFQTSTGEPLPAETKLVKILWKDTFRILSYSRDLRETKINEQKMRDSLERERKMELQKEAAQAANEAKSWFLANMSHEIRTPMNAVLGMAELLMQEGLNSRQARYVKDIRTSAVALLDIINDILDISKIQAGKLTLTPVHYDFNVLVDNVASIALFLVEDKTITFEMELADDTPAYLYGDDVRLRQVLLNLLSNAVKFTNEGHVRLSVYATEQSIHFVVSDTGIGIHPEDIQRLFEPFEQADSGKNRSKKGTGLGLSISMVLIKLMGGHLTVDSVYGEGTSFYVEIPKVLGNQELIQYVDGSEINISAPEAHVLIVDDNTINLNVAHGLLGLCQLSADTTTSGKKAIELVQQNTYDVVFMDHMMPEMNGIETTKAIRKLGIDVPIVALTASAITGTKEIMLEAGMNDYLSKPIIKAELRNILKKWIPVEKLILPTPTSVNERIVVQDSAPETAGEDIWQKINRIKGLSLATGLSRVDNQQDLYITVLKLMMKEIEKSTRNMEGFLAAGDMGNFSITVHGIKGSLANIGVMELSAKALELELAAKKADTEFCTTHLPALLEELQTLKLDLEDVFSGTTRHVETTSISPELSRIFTNLADALNKTDILAIDQEMESLNALGLSGTLNDEIEFLNDAVMMMDYENAKRLIESIHYTTNIEGDTYA
ncbi:MAG: ATP-binding protein [Peptococcaceae bacterium]|nr:ATP-binding protein [Peptococcaceae bacterium]